MRVSDGWRRDTGGMAMGGSEHRYACFGLDIRSEIALPELAGMSAPADCSTAPRITIRYGDIPADLKRDDGAGGARAVGQDAVLIHSRDTARYLVRGGAEIIVEPYAQASARNLRLFLLGPAFGALCHQRGLLPLHANAIVVDGCAIAFAGRAGIGKSTLAAFFQARGYPVLCDDVCVVSFDAERRPFAWPGLPRLKLWRDAAETFGHDSDTLERAIEGRDKYHVPLVPSWTGGPYPLARVYILRNAAVGAEARIVRLASSSAVSSLMANTYRPALVRRMGRVDGNFMQATAVAHHAAVFSAARHRGFDVFAREAARLEDHMRQSDVALGADMRIVSDRIT